MNALSSSFARLLGFGFLNPAFAIAGAALISIPIIIHLLNRRRFKVVTWAAMDFLLRAMRKNRKRLKFEQWLLLATRCLLISLLAFALARPLAGCSKSSLAGALGTKAGLNVFIIDNSGSTAFEANRPGPNGSVVKTHLDQEKLIAKRLIDGLNRGGESVAIVTAARPATAIIAKPGYDLNAAKAAIDRIEQSYAGTDLAGAMELARRLGADEPAGIDKRLYILTDGTRSAWEGPQSDAIKASATELAKTFKISHFNMTEGRQQWNHAIADVRPAADLVTTKFMSEFLATPRGYGAGPAEPIQWYLDRAPLGEPKVVALDPTSEAVVLEVQPTSLRSGGPHLFEARIGTESSPDALRADNARLRVVDVAAEVKVLIVEGHRGETALDRSGAFLQTALAPAAEREVGSGQPRSDSYIAIDLISDIELRGKVLNPYRAVVLAGVGQITDQEADALKAFVEQGGTLLVFMGEPVGKENYNAVMLPRQLIPGPLVKLVDSRSDGSAGYLFDFQPNKPVHPFIKLFQGKDNTGLDTAKVFIYWQVDVPADSKIERVLNYVPDRRKTPGAEPAAAPPAPAPENDNGPTTLDPAITHHRVGEGHVIFFATTAGVGRANQEWTSFPVKMAYVELMYEILAGGVRAGDYWMNLTVGQPLQIPPQVKLAGAPELRDDAGAVIPLEPVTEVDKSGAEKPTYYRSRPLGKPGVYTLTIDPIRRETVPIVVNVPADESDIRTVGNDAVRKAMGEIDMTLQGDEAPTDAAMARDANDWAGPTLIAVLLLLGAECFMAMSFGHYRRADVVRL